MVETGNGSCLLNRFESASASEPLAEMPSSFLSYRMWNWEEMMCLSVVQSTRNINRNPNMIWTMHEMAHDSDERSPNAMNNINTTSDIELIELIELIL